MEYLAYLRVRLGCLLIMHQAGLRDGSALEALTPKRKDLSVTREIAER